MGSIIAAAAARSTQGFAPAGCERMVCLRNSTFVASVSSVVEHPVGLSTACRGRAVLPDTVAILSL
jgi:hypothetical protein